jgi:tRNA pseudouridine38-40 synthase
MRSLKLVLAYDGTAYRGWQVQPQASTVQAAVEAAWRQATGEAIRVVASGRTDAGVHALGQAASLRTGSPLPVATLRRALNANLPGDVRVLAVTEAAAGFHAVRDALRKTYRYVLQDGGVPDPFTRRYCWYLPRRLDERAMQRAADPLTGEHDFASFQGAGSPRVTTVRTVQEFSVARHATELAGQVVIEITANGFLYNMVRNLVGTLVQVGQGRRDADWPNRILGGRDRRLAGPTAPPQGLFLVRVDYDSETSG